MENKLNRVLLIGSFLVLMCVGVSGCGRRSQQQADPPAGKPTEDPAISPAQSLEPSWTATVTPTPIPRATFIPGWGTSTPGPPIRLSGPIPGLFAPDIRLDNVVTGDQVNLSDYIGRPVLIVFWTTWCPHCAAEVSRLQSVYEQYRDEGFVILAPDVGEDIEKELKYRHDRGLTFTMLDDSKGTGATIYRIFGYPSHFFITRKGRVSSMWIGELDRAGIEVQVKKLFSPSL